jgi:hypothetical protein
MLRSSGRGGADAFMRVLEGGAKVIRLRGFGERLTEALAERFDGERACDLSGVDATHAVSDGYEERPVGQIDCDRALQRGGVCRRSMKDDDAVFVVRPDDAGVRRAENERRRHACGPSPYDPNQVRGIPSSTLTVRQYQDRHMTVQVQ